MKKGVFTTKKAISLATAAVIAAGALTVTGCGGSTETADGTSTTLNIYTWTEYIPDSVIEKFEDETGIKVNHTTFSSNEDMLAKVKSEDDDAFDIIQPSDYMVEQMASQGMLAELDLDKLTNLSNIGEQYLDPSYDPGNTYSIPYLGGVEAIAVNTDMVTDEITSYDDLFDPQYASQIVLLDDFRAVIGMTAKSLGYSMSTSDETELAEIKEKLLSIKPNVKLYDSDSPKSALISGECSIASVWSAEVALAMEEVDSIEVVYPEEGAYLFMDNWAIPAGSKNIDAAMEFINFMLDAENMALILEEFPYMCPNTAAVELMGEEYAANLAKNLPAEVIEKGEYIQNLDNDTLAIYDQMWTELKN
ncbi:MAG: spermidine/putrescine ABC transporter substrate-binding protein [Firmicutes bacterium]|nr:spermidine/putrescine ABC transporter substrate-binding protein [Bacillota bacterium]